MLPILLGLSIGFGLPLQTAINSKLRRIVGSPLLSSMVSFTVGTIFLASITLILSHNLNIASTVFKQPWWIWIGGLLGVVYLTGNIVLFPHLGSVQTVIMPVVGQLIMSMLIDNFGWFYSPQHSLNLIRIIGCALVFIGVILAVAAGSLFKNQGSLMKVPLKKSRQFFWQLAGIFTGMLSAMQTAINGHLGVVLNSAEKAALVSFVIGTVALWVIVIVREHQINLKPAFNQNYPWWIWIGGIIGALFVLENAFLVPLIGTGLAVVIVLFGMITGSLLVDHFGWLGANRILVEPIQLIGILVMLVGVVLIKLF
jgi:transporter family-2 protein